MVKGSSVPAVARNVGKFFFQPISSWYRRILYRSCNSQLRSPQLHGCSGMPTCVCIITYVGSCIERTVSGMLYCIPVH